MYLSELSMLNLKTDDLTADDMFVWKYSALKIWIVWYSISNLYYNIQLKMQLNGEN